MTRIIRVRSRGLRVLGSCLLACCIGAGTAFAQSASTSKATGAEDDVPVTRLKLQPARMSKPALKYALLPPYLDQTAGNGAPLYYRSLLYLRRADLSSFRTKALELSSQRLRDVPLADVQKNVLPAMVLWQEMDAAARRERCEWDLPIRGNRNVIGLFLDDAQEMRALGQWLSLRARLQAREGKYDDAIRSLQTGYAMSRDVSRIPFLITHFIGIAIASSTSQCVEEMTEFPGSPNLFWPLTALPHPLMDVRPSIETELALAYQMFPFLKDAETAEHAPAEWQRLLEQAINELRLFAGSDDRIFTSAISGKLSTTIIAMKSYPAAKQHLLDKGRTLEQIERMPVAQVLLIHMADSWDEVGQEKAKWLSLPYLEAQAGIDRAVKAEEQARQEPVLGTALPAMLMPALAQANVGIARMERRFAELRVIEALRDYAATHDRKLPAKLSDMTNLPIPSDPMTGQSFGYRLDGDTATLEIGAGKEWYGYRKRFELTVAK